MADRRMRMLFAALLSATAGGATAQPATSPLGASQLAFVSLVKGGYLSAFDEALGTVTFRPLRPMGFTHEPGPMEDEVTASAVRAAAAGDGALHGLKIKVACQAGAVVVGADRAATPGQAAELIDLALNENGVRQVSAAFPASLKKPRAS